MKKNTHFIPSHEGTLISNEKLENMLLQAVCPGWNWLLYETTIIGKDGEQDSFFVRFDHPAARLAYDITFSPEDPVRTLLKDLREMYDDYRGYYEDLGSCLDSVEATADLYNALCRAANVRDYPSPVGCVVPGEDGSTVIKRGKTTSGMLFKDWRAFYEHPDMPCYMPVLSDMVYTGNDFLTLAGGDPQVAGLIFQTSSWGFPEAELEELVREGIILSCRKCRKLYLKDDRIMPCPECGEYPYEAFMEKISRDIQLIQEVQSGLEKAQSIFGFHITGPKLSPDAQAQALHLIVSEASAYGVNKDIVHRISADGKKTVAKPVLIYARAYLENNFGFLCEEKQNEETDLKDEKWDEILVEKEFSEDQKFMETLAKMEDYKCVIRSNYFHVKDADAYRNMIQNVSGEDFYSWEKTDDNGNPVFAFGCNGAIHGILHTGDSGPLDVNVSYPEFLDKLREYVAEGDAVIISEIGHDKLQYLLGTAFIITSQWTESISLSDAAIETARKLLADPDYITTMAN